MIKNIFLTLIAFSFLIAEANHIIFSRITIKPDNAEMVSIYNPTSAAINLSNYYLSDLGGGNGDVNIPEGFDCNDYTDLGESTCNLIDYCEWDQQLDQCVTRESESIHYYNLPSGIDCFPQSDIGFLK